MSPRASEGGSNGKRLRALIADDEPRARQFLVVPRLDCFARLVFSWRGFGVGGGFGAGRGAARLRSEREVIGGSGNDRLNLEAGC